MNIGVGESLCNMEYDIAIVCLQCASRKPAVIQMARAKAKAAASGGRGCKGGKEGKGKKKAFRLFNSHSVLSSLYMCAPAWMAASPRGHPKSVNTL